MPNALAAPPTATAPDGSPSTFAAADVLAAARALEAAGRDVVHLEVGEPDKPTPAHVVDAGIRAIQDGHTRYGPVAGIPELRAAVAESLRGRGIPAVPDAVLVGPGAKSVLYAALMAAVTRGDEVLVPDPGYPTYAAVAARAGGLAVRYPATDGEDLADALGDWVTPRTRVLVLNSPHNPTGGVLGERTLARVADLARRHELMVVSDEIYARHVFDGGAAPSIAALPDMMRRTVVVDGCSKSHAMTGWRLGYGVVPDAIRHAMSGVLADSVSCTATFVQHAGLAALTGPQDHVAAQVAELRDRRDWLVDALRAIPGVDCARPRGAFYLFPRVAELLARTDETTEALARRLLCDYGLACVPGTAFGPAGTGHLRLSYAAPRGDLERAAERLRACAADAFGAAHH